MSDRSFLDTNILVYTFDRDDPEKQRRARGLVEGALETGNGILSYQVVQEFLNVALRKFSVPLTLQECRDYLADVLNPLCAVFPDAALYGKALDINGATGFSFYDSLIVAAACRGECGVLYSEDLQHGREIEGVTILNPFA